MTGYDLTAVIFAILAAPAAAILGFGAGCFYGWRMGRGQAPPVLPLPKRDAPPRVTSIPAAPPTAPDNAPAPPKRLRA